MYNTVDQLGIDSSNLSLKDAMSLYGGWNAILPAQASAEFYKVGKHHLRTASELLWSNGLIVFNSKIIQYKICLLGVNHCFLPKHLP